MKRLRALTCGSFGKATAIITSNRSTTTTIITTTTTTRSRASSVSLGTSGPLSSSFARFYSRPSRQLEPDNSPVPYFDASISDSEWRQKTEQLVGLFQASSTTTTTATITPRDVVATESTIRYWTAQRTTPDAVLTCFQLLDLMTKHSQMHPELLSSGDLSYFMTGNYPRATHLLNAVMDAWRIQFEGLLQLPLPDNKRNMKNTRRLLPDPAQVLDEAELYASRGVPLNCRTYSIIMQASLAKQHFDNDTPVFCEQILNRMLQQPHTMPDTVAFTTAIHAWSKSTRPEAPLRAEQLFQELTHMYDNHLLDDPPNTVTYNTVLDAMCRSKQTDVIRRAHQLFASMRTSPYATVSPTTVTYRIMMNGWSSISHLDKACALLHDMVQLYQAGSTDVQVDATFFSKLISILAKSKDKQNHQRARELYQVLQRLHQETSDARFSPDELFTMRAMIIVYSKLQQPDLAEALLQRLEKQAFGQVDAAQQKKLLPKRGHYRDVLFAWTKSKDAQAAERAERILLRMINVLESEPGLVDSYTVDSVLMMWCQQSQKGQYEVAQRGESLLRQLVSLNREKNMDVCKIGRSSYLHVMKGYGHMPERMEDLLAELKALAESDASMSPTRIHYTVAATAWTKSKRKEAPDRIRRLVQEAEQDFGRGIADARPDKALYRALIHCHAQRGDAAAAENAWNQLMDQADGGNKLAMPTIAEFNLVLLASLRSDEENEVVAKRVKRLMLAIHCLGLSPDARTQSLLAEIKSARRSS